MRRALLLLLLAVSACATKPPVPAAPEDVFFTRLEALCGARFEGRLTTADAADAAMRGQRMIMHVRDCAPGEIRIPFQVGQDRSRTWVVTRTAAGLRLKHDHRHEDGTQDARSNYGGDSRPPASAERVEFPADEFSKAMFITQGIPQSAANVWALELRPGALFAYELRRPGREFRAEFDLTRQAAPAP
ncbi:MAG: hypothetical protein M3M95_07645 [Pseudomonadota bacterium]|nr:hypothetical protein [Pseudomonadota bacterium]